MRGEDRMEKIVPFKKDIIFKTNLSEITSISLEHHLDTLGTNEITGNFIVSGEYKITDTSMDVESFSYELPFHITLDEKYILDQAEMDIDDFYYEIINDTVLSVNIDVLIRNLDQKIVEDISNEKEMEEVETREEKQETIDIPTQRCIEDEEIASTLFDQVHSVGETYKSYRVCIIREGDTIEKIIEKYETNKEELEEYNDLSDIKIGDKIIIPS